MISDLDLLNPEDTKLIKTDSEEEEIKRNNKQKKEKLSLEKLLNLGDKDLSVGNIFKLNNLE